MDRKVWQDHLIMCSKLIVEQAKLYTTSSGETHGGSSENGMVTLKNGLVRPKNRLVKPIAGRNGFDDSDSGEYHTTCTFNVNVQRARLSDNEPLSY